MNNIVLIFLLIQALCGFDLKDKKIESVFLNFQSALKNGDCEKLIELSDFPIDGDIGLARLIDSEAPREQMEEYNYEITKELLNQNCMFLTPIELEVLTQFNFEKQSLNHGIKHNDCIYKSEIFISEDKSYFQYFVGCVELINKNIGEYSIVFTFKLIDGEYKLKQINGIG